MKNIENCLDSQLWHACAGGMVQMPLVNSLVYYSPQGHSEHAKSSVEFDNSMQIPPMILCRVKSVKYKADSVTDEVFTEIKLVPLKPHELDYDEDEGISLGINRSEIQEKPLYFVKTLTQSDANNGGGFSVPRYCAETIFPRLDYSATPPVQIVLVKDLHGKIWKFRHIYRGTPRRHLLTTGWSNFVGAKKLVAGDSVVFLRTDNGDLCVGIRRAKVGHDLSEGWNHKNCTFGGFGVYMMDGDKRLLRDNDNISGINSDPNSKGKGKLKVDSVMDAATLAASGLPFEVVYYPRAAAPEFVVKASVVRAAMRVQWCSGMRFKMAFETEDSSRISWFMGTISSVQVADPIRWPGSPWRLLEVTWDEPDLLQNVKRVNPWLVELVSTMSAIHLEPFSPPRKKHRIAQHLDSPFDLQISSQSFVGSPLIPSLLDGTTPAASIQGARHIQHGTSLPELHFRKLQPGLFYSGIHCFARPPIIPTGLIPPKSPIYEDDSNLLKIGCPPQSVGNECNKESKANKPHIILFGKQIFTEPQLSLSLNSSLDMNSDRSDSGIRRNGKGDGSPSDDRLPWHWDLKANDISPEIVQCKVFMESENIGRTLDLSAFDSYEEMYRRLTNMFGIEISELTSRIIYRDTAGAVKHPEDEPFALQGDSQYQWMRGATTLASNRRNLLLEGQLKKQFLPSL
ncbi:auxin response factor 18 isoform X1 [Dendrobium catenatum]|uniref:auxin response factor 18 isoform X1 n=1 Tax=Dendrobium catenatum TaxID=906689 RepID=UPI0009F40B73|nr:auxin response factor 18 isoform X1 [Dendrobium catenatum]XP_020695697.1 auxin response factor 18 isoform X1 [Dendrobium catenatum]XP_020695700.1 auxin response factor 18 isoform X1 [Dendrobium catenatum]